MRFLKYRGTSGIPFKVQSNRECLRLDVFVWDQHFRNSRLSGSHLLFLNEKFRYPAWSKVVISALAFAVLIMLGWLRPAEAQPEIANLTKTDINTSTTGTYNFNSGTYTIGGAGTGIGGTADSFRLVSTSISGNVEIIANVSSITTSGNPSAFAGLMMRSTLNPDSIQASVGVTPSNGVNFLFRTTTGGNTNSTLGPSITVPRWLRLVKSAGEIAGYQSTDGYNWTLVGKQKVNIAPAFQIGFAVSSNASGAALNSSVFSNVSLLNSVPQRVIGSGLETKQMMAWLRSDVGVSVSSGRVNSWLDQSGKGNNASQTVVGPPDLRPLFQPNVAAANGLNVVSFDGSDQWLKFLTGFNNLGSGVHVYAVTRPESASASKTLFWTGKMNAAPFTDALGISMLNPSGNQLATVDSNNNLTVVSNTNSLTLNTYQILEVSQNGANSGSIWTNGVNKGTQTVNNISSITRPFNYFGRNPQNGFNYKGQIAEFLVYDHALTESQRNGLQSYFLSKYNIGFAGASGPRPTLLPPVISPGDSVTNASSAEISITAEPGAAIYYTIDGSAPSTSSPLYTGPFSITSSKTVRAIAWQNPSFFNSSTETQASVQIDPSTGYVTKDGLGFWFKADNGFYSNASGVTWKDMGPMKYEAKQLTSANKPTFAPNAVNNLPAISFDGTDDFLNLPSTFITANNFQNIFVVTKAASVANSTFMHLSPASGNNRIVFSQGSTGGKTKFTVYNGVTPTSVESSSSVVSNAQFGLFQGQNQASTLTGTLFANGSVVGSGSLGPMNEVTRDTNYIGQALGGTNRLNGQIAEIIAYHKELNDEQRQNIEAYIYQRYGVGNAPPPIFVTPKVFSDASVDVELSSYGGLDIYYTTNGTTPTTSSTKYTTPFTISATTTVKAIAVKAGFTPSVVVTALYQKDLSAADVTLDGLAYWFKSDNGVQLNGSTVSNWTNILMSRNASQTSAANQPGYSSTSANGLPAVTFNGTNQFLNLDLDNAQYGFGFSYFIVTKSNSGNVKTGARYFDFGRTNNANNNISFGQIAPNIASLSIYHDNKPSTFAVNNSLQPSKYQILGGVHTGTEAIKFFQNGVLQGAQGRLFNPFHERLERKYLGRDVAGTSSGFLNGEIAEILIYTKVLSDDEREHVETYLKARYNLMKPPVISPGTGVFTGTTEVSLSVENVPTAEIYYTTNGSDPTTASTPYSGPFNVSSTATVKAIAKMPSPSTELSPIASARIQIDAASALLEKDGLKLWLRSDNSLVSDGSSAGFWQDMSGQNNSAAQSLAAGLPAYVSSPTPALSLNGSSQFLQIAPGISNFESGASIFVVTKAGSLVADSKVLSINPEDGFNQLNFGQGSDSTGKQKLNIWFGGTQTNLQSPTASFSTSTFNLHEAIQTASSTGTLFLNGTQNAQGAISDIPFVARTQNFIGQGFDGVNKYNGQVAEILVYDKPLTISQRTNLEAYLLSRYNFPVTAPIVSPGFGVFAGSTQVTISGPLNAEIRYTLNGPDPGPSSTLYTGPFTLSGNGTTVIKAIYVLPGGAQSPIAFGGIQIDSTVANLTQSGLNLWLKGDYGIITSTAPAMNAWLDASGNGHTAVTQSAVNQPTLVNPAVNGLPAVSFNGTNSYMYFAAAFANFTNGATILMAVKPSTLSSGRTFFDFGNGASNNNILLDERNNAGRVQFHSYSGATDSNVQADTGMSTSAYCILEVVHTGGQFASIYKDGVLIAQDTIFNIANVLRTGPYLGVQYGGGSGFYAGQIAEMLLYNRALTKAERLAAEGYLFSRYGFGVSQPVINPGSSVVSGVSQAISITAAPGASIYYTTNGSTPTTGSTPYAGTFNITSSTTIKAIAVINSVTSSVTTSFIQFDSSTANVSKTGLNLWLKADYGTTTSGASVTNWADMSGNYNDAAQPTPTNQPTLVSNAINSLPAVNFDGTNDFMQLPPGFTSIPGTSIFLVTKITALANGRQLFNFGDIGANNNVFLEYDSSGNLTFHVENSGSNSEVTTTGGVTAGVYKVIEIRHNGAGNITFYSNGVQIGSGTITNPNYITRPNNFVGKSSGSNYLNGQLAEFLFYARPLNTTERFDVNSYLNAKYRLTTASPIISIPTGVYTSTQSVTLTAEPGATIYYTTDGSTPTTGSNVYSIPIPVSTSAILKAIAVQTTWSPALTSIVSTSYIQVDATTSFVNRSGMNLWLKADMGVSTSGSSVTEWLDMSNNNNSASQATPANRPTLVANAINGKPAIDFNSANSQFMQFGPGFANYTAGAGIFMVLKPTTLVNNKAPFDFGNGSTNANFKFEWNSTGSAIFDVVNAGLEQSIAAAGALTAGTYKTVGIVHSGAGTASLYINGTLATGPASIYNITNVLRSSNMLGKPIGGSNHINGQIAEMIMYNRAPTSFERQSIDAYFFTKYALGTATQLNPPVITPPTGLYATTQTVTMSSDVGAPIYYTLDGSTPTTLSTQYSGPFNRSVTTTIKAIAASPAYTASAVTTNLIQIDSTISTVPREGMNLWLRSDVGLNSSGSNVTSWADMSGSNNHASQAVSANQPTVVTNVINSLPAVNFNGATQFMQFGSGFSDYSAGASIFVVTKPQSVFVNSKILSFSPSDGVGRFHFGVSSTVDKALQFSVTPPAPGMLETLTSSSRAINPRTFQMLGLVEKVIANLGYATLYSNGNAVGTLPVSDFQSFPRFSTIPNVLRTLNYLGQNYAGGDRYQGQIAEVLMYNRNLTPVEQSAVESYLLNRYKLVTAPVITPSTGVKSNTTQTISIVADVGDQIYYTTNGTTPTTSSTQYTAPFSVTGDPIVVKAIAVRGADSSAVTTSTIQIDPNSQSVLTDYLSLWLRADFGLTTTGSNVSHWMDMSGNSNDADQPTSANQPTIVSNTVNGHPAVNFNGTSQYMSFANDLADFSRGFAAFIVTKPATLSTNAKLFDFCNASDKDNVTCFEGSAAASSASVQTKIDSTASTLTGTNVFVSGQHRVVTLLQKGAGTGEIWLNGQQSVAGALTNAMATLRTNNVLGASGTGTNPYGGQIAEILVYNKALTVGEKNAVESYLRNKYQPSLVLPTAPIISVAGGSLTKPTQVAITSQAETTIYYTTDNSTPTTSSALYSGPINIMFSQTLKAIAVRNGVSSSVSTAAYTISDAASWPAPNPSDATPLDINLQLPTNAIPQ